MGYSDVKGCPLRIEFGLDGEAVVKHPLKGEMDIYEFTEAVREKRGITVSKMEYEAAMVNRPYYNAIRSGSKNFQAALRVMDTLGYDVVLIKRPSITPEPDDVKSV